MRRSKWEQSYCVFDATLRLILNFKTPTLSHFTKYLVRLKLCFVREIMSKVVHGLVSASPCKSNYACLTV